MANRPFSSSSTGTAWKALPQKIFLRWRRLWSRMAVEDAVSAQFRAEIPAFAKPTFERLRRARHSAQYFDPSAPPLTASDAAWAIEKAKEALAGVKALMTASPPERFG